MASLIRQLFGRRKQSGWQESHRRQSGRRTVSNHLLRLRWDHRGGVFSIQRHADTLLALSDRGPEDERSKVTPALLLMSTASLSHSASSTDPGGVAPAEWQRHYTLSGCLGRSVDSGCDSLLWIHHRDERKGIIAHSRWRWESSAQSTEARNELKDCEVSPE